MLLDSMYLILVRRFIAVVLLDWLCIYVFCLPLLLLYLYIKEERRYHYSNRLALIKKIGYRGITFLICQIPCNYYYGLLELSPIRPTRYNTSMTQSNKKPLTDEERQAFIDKLSVEQVNPNAQEIFEDTIERAAQPPQSKPGTPDSDDGYTDTQTHSHKAEGTSVKRSDTSRR